MTNTPSLVVTPELALGWANINGTSLRGYLDTPWSFEETVARLLALAPDGAVEYDIDGKVAVEVTGTFRGEPFSVYDWKGSRGQLHLGGHRSLDVLDLGPALVAALETVTPRPISVRVDSEWGGGRIVWP